MLSHTVMDSVSMSLSVSLPAGPWAGVAGSGEREVGGEGEREGGGEGEREREGRERERERGRE